MYDAGLKYKKNDAMALPTPIGDLSLSSLLSVGQTQDVVGFSKSTMNQTPIREWLVTEGNHFVAQGEFRKTPTGEVEFVGEKGKPLAVPVWVIVRMMSSYAATEVLKTKINEGIVETQTKDYGPQKPKDLGRRMDFQSVKFHINSLKGRILTILDASVTNAKQHQAMKSLVSAEVWEQLKRARDAMYGGLVEPSTMPGLVEDEITEGSEGRCDESSCSSE